MPIKPIPLDGLHIIKQFVAARRFMVFDREADETMRLVVELVNQIQHQHDEPGPSSQDPVSVPSGTCPGCSVCLPEKQRALDAQYLEIVQLREVVKARDEHIRELNTNTWEWRKGPSHELKQAVVDENKKLKEELDSLRRFQKAMIYTLKVEEGKSIVKTCEQMIEGRDALMKEVQWRSNKMLTDGRKMNDLQNELNEVMTEAIINEKTSGVLSDKLDAIMRIVM